MQSIMLNVMTEINELLQGQRPAAQWRVFLSALVAGANVSVLIIHIDTGTGKTSRGNKAIILMPKKNMIE